MKKPPEGIPSFNSKIASSFNLTRKIFFSARGERTGRNLINEDGDEKGHSISTNQSIEKSEEEDSEKHILRKESTRKKVFSLWKIGVNVNPSENWKHPPRYDPKTYTALMYFLIFFVLRETVRINILL